MQRAQEPNGLRGTLWCTSSPLLLLRRLAGLAEPAAGRSLLARGLTPALRRLPRLLLRVALRLAVPALLRRLARLRGPAAGGVRPARRGTAATEADELPRRRDEPEHPHDEDQHAEDQRREPEAEGVPLGRGGPGQHIGVRRHADLAQQRGAREQRPARDARDRAA